MGNIRRYYYANKTKIWRGILIVAFILVIIQVLNYMQKMDIGTTNNEGNTTTSNTVINNTSLTTDKSAIGGGNINATSLKQDITIIDNFLNLCNNKQFEKAYELLSEECKENCFKTYDVFKRTYCDIKFNNYKTYTTQNWSGNTYKVRITEDILATGNTSNGVAIQEYITLVENEGTTKLNINNYISREKINQTQTKNNVTIEVVSVDTFYEYEIYNIEVKNNTSKEICLDNGEDTTTLYIEDSNGIKYEAISTEIMYNEFKIPAGSSMKYSIKYANSYRTNREIEKLVFENVILDSENDDIMELEITF